MFYKYQIPKLNFEIVRIIKKINKMKYGLGIRMLIAFIAGGLAIMYKIKINPRYKQSEINVLIKAPRKFTFDVLTDPKNVPQYFSWVTELKDSAFDRRNISLGKRYYGVVNMPFLGQHEIKYRVTELKDLNWLTLRPDLPQLSWFNTEITLMFFTITNDQTHFGMKIAYHRTSALFQITLGRFLRYITDQQLERAAIAAKNLVKIKWEKFRYPHGRGGNNNNLTKAVPSTENKYSSNTDSSSEEKSTKKINEVKAEL